MTPEKPPDPDPEIAILAQAIGEDPVSDIEAPQSPKPAPKKDEEKPPEEPPDTSGETAEETAERVKKEAEEATKGKPKKGELGYKELDGDDPLKDLELKNLLEHPVLGPALQHWSDTAGNTRINLAVERERESLTASAKLTAEEEQADAHFASMTKEQIAEEIGDDADAAVKYAQYQARLRAGARGSMPPEAVAKASEVYAVSAQVLLNTQMLEGSELPPEVKNGLKPENYNKPGGEGLNAWGEAIFKALVTHEAQAIAEQLKESEWEAYKQEHLAEIDGERPAATGGRRTANLPDLITTPTDQLWDGAFKDRPLDKEGAK